MAKRKSIVKGAYLDDIVTRGILRRVMAKDNALKMYALGYKRGNAEFAGWLLYALNRLEQHRDELLKLPNKERATKVMDLISQFSKEWRSMDKTTKQEWIKRAKDALSAEKTTIENDIKLSEELEKLAEEAYKGVEELATVVT